MTSFTSEIWTLLKARKKWWLALATLLALILIALAVAGHGKPNAPFVYTPE